MNANPIANGSWIAVQVRTSSEINVRDGLRERGYEEFLPLRANRSLRGRERRSPQALFPGYIFCRYIHAPAYRIVEMPGVVRLVGTGKTPIPIPQMEIDAIRRVVDSGLYSEPWRFLAIGEPVIVRDGVLRGITGTLVSIRNTVRLVISVTLLGRAVAVEIDAMDVLPVRSNTFSKSS